MKCVKVGCVSDYNAQYTVYLTWLTEAKVVSSVSFRAINHTLFRKQESAESRTYTCYCIGSFVLREGGG